MTLFLIAAAVMVAAALFFILPTLLRDEKSGVLHAQRDALNLQVLREQLVALNADRDAGVIDDDVYQSSRSELERRVAEDVRPNASAKVVATTGKPVAAILLGVAVPVLALTLYLLLGNPTGLDPQKVATNTTDAQQNITPEQVNAMVEKLANHLKEKPDDVTGWSMLARSYNALGRYKEAADAYSHLKKLIPANPDLLADYADALGMANNRSLLGEPEELIKQALAIDPRHIKSLALSGGASFERKDYAAAIGQWKKILALIPPDSDIARSVNSSIEEAQKLGGIAATPTSAAPASAATTATSGSNDAAGAQVSGTVELDPTLRSQVSDSDTVFIFARAIDGPRFPLAVLRKQVKDLPVSFTLDDSMSMMPSAKLSGFSQVIVGARISKSGSATPSAGDLEGVTDTVKPGAKDLKIRIATQRN